MRTSTSIGIAAVSLAAVLGGSLAIGSDGRRLGDADRTR